MVHPSWEVGVFETVWKGGEIVVDTIDCSKRKFEMNSKCVGDEGEACWGIMPKGGRI
jgi:hypothetical protein